MEIGVKKMMRACLSLVAAGGLVASMAACGNPSASDELTLTFWGGDIDKTVMNDRLALAAKKYPDIKVKAQYIAKDYDTKIQTMFSGGTAPDILEMAENINAYSSRGQLENLTPHFKKAGVDPAQRFGEANAKAYSYKGNLYGAPDRSAPGVVYYNKDMFDAAGLKYPSADWSWQDFHNAAVKLTKRSGDKTDVWGYCEGDWWAWYMTWMYQNGGGVVDSAGKPIANDPANVEALTFYHDLMWKDKVAPTPQQITDTGADPLFAKGKLAMEVTGFWNIAALKDAKFNWGIAPMWHGKKKAVPMFSNALAVSSKSKHKEEAIKLVLFLSSKEGQRPIAQHALDVPANVEAAKDDSFVKASWNKNDLDLTVFSKSIDMVYAPPLVPQWNQITQAFTDGMAQTWNGKQSVKDGLDKVQKTLQGALG
ncbi:ABC transporter substrate-binding protein [Bifidobacterium favimelis]|uniref:Sugar ABC transporter substrate-binding protein n=1 Tax=Bifidobacterium favimelis TaxID=3122979 RepID=A0ABU8ZMK2_9BIFI